MLLACFSHSLPCHIRPDKKQAANACLDKTNVGHWCLSIVRALAQPLDRGSRALPSSPGSYPDARQIVLGTQLARQGGFQNLAQERGGKGLSEEYVNRQTPLTFQWAAGHIWNTRGAGIKRGSWCGMCVNVGRRSRFKAKL